MRTSDLAAWGWNEHWQSVWEAEAPPDAEPARVLEEHRDRYRVTARDPASPDSRVAVLVPSARRAAVGDWVAVREGGPDGAVRIAGVLPRRTQFSRGAAGEEGREQVVAANIDVVWIVHGLDLPVNPRRIERYLTAAWESGARPVIVLTKSDLHEDPEAARREAADVTLGVPVRVVSMGPVDDVAELDPDLEPGATIALLGPSGVGKSTLVNRLLGRDVLATGDVREVDRKGRHTTTSRHLVPLPGGALLLDTPGMRELQLFDVDSGLDRAFQDIRELAAGCRYRDCAHDAEPGCAVKAAVEDGRLDPDRLSSYHKLQAEAEWQARRDDPLARQEEVSRYKAIMKSMKAHPKYRR